MIITNLIGGLGNQMFQYACARAVSLRAKRVLRIVADQFTGYALHNGFELQSTFVGEFEKASIEELKSLLGWQAAPILRGALSKSAMNWVRTRHWAQEPHFQYWSAIRSISASTYLHGYWQSELYFADVADHIRADFAFRMPWDQADCGVRDRMQSQPSASLHVRRGDYTTAKNKGVYALGDLHYYREAILSLSARVPGIRFFAFSDDPDWVIANLADEFSQIEVVRHNCGARSANDMRLMSRADHHIIANSSFSWWGAWLNPASEKIVIAPKRWFSNGTNDKDLIPSNWLRI